MTYTAKRRTWLVTGVSVAMVLAAATPAAAISGGRQATQRYPFMASLQADGTHFCGGTLIRPLWIVTAKHCVLDRDGNPKDPGKIRVRLGSNNRTQGGEIRRGARIEPAPAATSDMALLKLDAPSRHTPAALPRTELTPGDTVRTIGWGDHQLPENPGDPWPPPPIQLRQLDSRLLDPGRCLGMSGEPMEPGELCMAALPGKGKWPQTTRAGDSGGPLLKRANGIWTVYGAVSRGTRDQHGIYGSVHGALPWIKDTLRRS
ncbi:MULTISPECIES: trypsin-like serine protease [unclassified Crossiella]|uniref:S1 family peptidase n=1 Tax=unclassified Crossiella TaxID=2620835 RepID=UPI001FFFCBE7|nr:MULTISPECIES: serine protease [unclassified Crossiella]MCK2244477.1 serine protease [Crossiella sp. S99.2]MCK2258108.1 serine protease [Crossiella sp. S99.1]